MSMNIVPFWRPSPSVGGRQFGSGCAPPCDNFWAGGCPGDVCHASLPTCNPPQPFTAFLTALIQQILQTNPALIAQMPIIGVTDGSNAMPGTVGEVATQTTNGSVAVGSPWSFTAITLQPGDWDIQGTASFDDVGAAAGNYLNYLEMLMYNGSTPIADHFIQGNWTTGTGITKGNFATGITQVNVAVPTPIPTTVWIGGNVATSANVIFKAYARRAR